MNLRRNRGPPAYTYSFLLDVVLTNARDLLKLLLLCRQLPTRSGRQPLQKSSLAPTAECSLPLSQLGPRRNNRTVARRVRGKAASVTYRYIASVYEREVNLHQSYTTIRYQFQGQR
ncbi:hypothetical protein NDU88_001471 [Pleurodeles waltl]|uniref:Uncharacterized protein n=1 Tax=Pleurodeles waltl TaxID=8319 RepID=A0AAV7SZE4_PLEWA|nr:hypothetical protein NDU88_001471 [Pleurodeles waltl]